MAILQARRYQIKGNYQPAGNYQPLDADLTAVAASGLAAAWTAYTPTVSAGGGTFTTVSATGKYLVIGKLTLVQIAITITTLGSATTPVIATLPNTSNGAFVFSGRSTVTGKMLQGLTSGTSVSVWNYDNSFAGASGVVLTLSGSYENT